ncbi:class I SAM-dependent methyltransferase [Neisseria sp. Ec49-e6-T10]|uniref:class I SAM-dependent methyltransferase n=1 Tax=Neisseria sp. Ec49-e6-T10 TaxID=3140744 RepID=UPI003EB736D9
MSRQDWTNDQNVAQYLQGIGLAEPEILKELRQQTADHRLAKMAISPSQAQFLMWLVKLINAKHYLELGVFTGYSSTAVGLTLPEDGTVTACDINKSFTDIAQQFWHKAGIDHKITLHLQPALFTLDELLEDGKINYYDLILIDADKPTTPQYYERCIKLLKIGGLIVIDNILLGGRILDNELKCSEDVPASINIMRQFNQNLHQDHRISPIALPMGDGTIILRKECD